MMLDWNDYQRQLGTTIAQIGRISPDTIRGYRGLADAGSKSGVLDGKTRELIALAVSVTRQCDGCITIHTDAAIKQGATREEIVAALSVAITVNAGASLVYSARGTDARHVLVNGREVVSDGRLTTFSDIPALLRTVTRRAGEIIDR